MAEITKYKLYTTSGQAVSSNTDIYFNYEISKLDVLNAKSTIKWDISTITQDASVNGVKFETIEVKYNNNPSTTKIASYEEVDIDFEGANTESLVLEPKLFTFGNTSYGNISIKITGYLKRGNYVSPTRNIWEATIYTNNISRIEPTMVATSATNFTDEENPVITYMFTQGYKSTFADIKKIEACISFTGGADDVKYREIPLPTAYDKSASYAFELTEEERKVLRKGVTSGYTKQVRFYIKTTIYDLTNDLTRWNYTDAILTLVNCEPILTPVARDVNAVTVALTGNENKIIKGRSNVYFETGATAKKEAAIALQTVVNGTKSVKNQASGIIEAVESNVFTFNATDSRGINAEAVTVELDVLPYIPLTCNQAVEMELVNENDTNARVTVTGNYFSGSFGTVQNELKIEIRRTGDDFEGFTEWVDVTPLLPEVKDNKYTLSFNVEGLKGGSAYDFQCRATDKLGTVEAPVYTARLIPVFDWSETDFNFNVPVNIEGDLTVGGSLTTKDGSSFLLPYILSDSATDGNVTLNDDVSNYEYIEIFYTDNNNKAGGYTRFIPPNKGASIEVSLALIQAATNSTYIRRTSYVCRDKALEVNAAFTGYCWIRNTEITHSVDKNYLKVVRVVGYK